MADNPFDAFDPGATAVPATTASAPNAATTLPTGTLSPTDVINLARSRGDEYVPTQAEATGMSQDLAEIAARRAAGPSTKGPTNEIAPANPFDAFDVSKAEPTPPPTTAPAPTKPAGAWQNFVAGAEETVPHILGAPVDALTAAARGIGPSAPPDDWRQRHETAAKVDDWARSNFGEPTPTYPNPEPVGGSAWISSLLKSALNWQPESVQPQDESERIARAEGRGAAAFLVPWAPGAGTAAATVGRALTGEAAPAVATALPLATARSWAGQLVGQALTGVGAGAAGEAAKEAAPPALAPTAEVAGQLVGGAGAAATYEAGRGLLGSLVSKIGSGAASLFGGAEQTAGRRIAAAATDPEAVKTALANQPEPLVPGSEPTTFQLTGDMGLGQLERTAAVTRPEAFKTRAAEQNAARMGAVEGLTPGEANPAAVGQFFRNELDSIDGAMDTVVQGAREQAGRSLGAIGGEGTPTEYGASARTAISQRFQPGIDAAAGALTDAQGRAASALERIGGASAAPGEEGTATALQRYGDRIRGVLQGADDEAKTREGALWSAIDPDGTLTAPTTPIRDAARAEAKSMSPLAEPMGPREAALFDDAQKLGPVTPFKDLIEYRKRLTNFLRQELWENGRGTQPYARVSRLLDSVHASLEGGVQEKAADDAAAVAAGKLDPNDTLAANLIQARDQWRAENAGAGRNAQQGGAGNAGAGARAVPGTPGTAIPAGGVSGGPAGDQGVPRATLDEDAAARYAAARAATRERLGTYHEGAPGRVLAKGATAGEYRLPDSQVAAAFFNSGKHAAEDVQQFLAASGGREQAVNDLADYAAFDLRRNAVKDGQLNLTAYRRWLGAHDDALSAFPELRARFETASQARAAVDAAGDQLETLKAAFPIRPGKSDADVIADYWKAGPDGADNVRRYMTETGPAPGAPATEAHLRRADNLADYAAWSLRQAAVRDGELKPNLYDAWMRRYDSALSAAPGLRDRFANAATAQRTLDDAAAQKAAVVKAYESSAAQHFLGADPLKAVQSALASRDPAATFAQLVRMTGSDEAASQGLRRAVVDYIRDRLVSNTEAATSGVNTIKSDQFQTFVRRNGPALEQLFTPEQMQSINNVAADLQRSNRSISATKLPGGSNTPQDIAAAQRFGTRLSTLGRVAGRALGAAAGYGLAGPWGVIGEWIGADIIRAARETGIRSVNDLIAEAMLNPSLARDLLLKTEPGPMPAALSARIARDLRALPVASAVTAATSPSTAQSQAQEPVPRDAGGRVGLDHGPDRVGTFAPRYPIPEAMDFLREQQAERAQGRQPFARGGAAKTPRIGDPLAIKPHEVEGNPSDHQKRVGNYRKAHRFLRGLHIVIENPKGSIRKGVGKDGKPWRSILPAHYGYLRKTVSGDDEHLDVYLGEHFPVDRVFVIDQKHDHDGTWDEAKAMLGFPGVREAVDTYVRGFSDGKGANRIGAVTEMPFDDFKRWLAEGDTKTPLAMKEAKAARAA